MKSHDRTDSQESTISNVAFWVIAAFLTPFVCIGLGISLGNWVTK